MAQNTDFQSFIRLAVAEMGTIPRRGLIYLGLAAVISAGADILLWMHRPDFEPVDWAVGAGLTFGAFCIIYLISMLMIGAKASLAGGLRFMATSLAMAVPALLGAGLLLLGLKIDNPLAVVSGAVLIAVGVVVLSWLPGWPIWQATSTRLVGPLTALNSTKGLRWGLFLTSFITSGVNKLVPNVSTADTLMGACILAAGSAAIGFLSTLFGVGLAVTAYRLMSGDSGDVASPEA